MSAILAFAKGTNLLHQGKFSDAIKAFKAAVVISPHKTEYYWHVAVCQHNLGDIEGSIKTYTLGLNINPDDPAINTNIGAAYHALAKFDLAVEHSKKVPNHPSALSNLGNALIQLHRPTEAYEVLRKALEIDFTNSAALNNLGNVFMEQGRVDDALVCFHKSEGSSAANFNKVGTLMYVCDDPAVLLRAAKSLGGVICEDPPPRKPIRRAKPKLGFISADLRTHPVGIMTIRTIEYLKAQGNDMTFYYNAAVSDHLTDRFKACGTWVEAFRMTDEQLINVIRKDEIEILFDLTGYTAGHRMGVFANRSAPVQAAWFGYPGPTGVQAMDYLVGDRYQIEGLDEFFTEKLIPVDCCVSFEPFTRDPIPPAPYENNGYITYGSFNAVKKISPDVISLWRHLLEVNRKARLVIKTHGMNNPETRQRYADMFGGVMDRVEFMGNTPMEVHRWVMGNKVDIALDSFPYSGGLTTLEAMWMGLPVVTMPGRTYCSRHAASYMRLAGYAVADGPRDYIDMAMNIDPVKFRRHVRGDMLKSPICADGKSFEKTLGEMM